MNNGDLHNEQEFLLKVSQGDEAAFREVYRYYQEQLKPLVWKFAGPGIEAEEILQETFVKVWLNRDRLPEIVDFRAWIFKVASREYLMALRKKLHYTEKLHTYSANKEPGQNGPPSPFSITHLEEMKQCIQQAIGRLPPQRKTIYEMSRNEGLKIEEIAQKLSIAPRTVKNVLSTVLKYIREYLTAAGFGPLVIACIIKIVA